MFDRNGRVRSDGLSTWQASGLSFLGAFAGVALFNLLTLLDNAARFVVGLF